MHRTKKFNLPEGFRAVAARELSRDQNQVVDRLPKGSGINIVLDRDLKAAVVTDSGQPIAGLWTSWRAARFTFDVIVCPTAKGRGIAKHLVDQAIRDFNAERPGHRDPLFIVDVVSPAMRRILEEHFGFSVALSRGSNRWEMIPTTDDAGCVLIPGPVGSPAFFAA
jgi:ribosomal protein S18 acetylase RimI-like enzyme